MLPEFLQSSPIIQELYKQQEETMARAQNGLKSVGSLWKGQCKNGTMLSGFISVGVLGNDINLMIFPNSNKKNANDPDYFISVKTDTKEPDVPLPPKTDDL